MRSSSLSMLSFIMLFCTLGIGVLPLAGCKVDLHAYDENSDLHSTQAVRNESLVDGGLDDAAIDHDIETAWRICDPEPDLTPATGLSAPSAEQLAAHDAWLARYEAGFFGFRMLLRQWCFSDLERGIRLNQADAWHAYEETKRPDDVEPPVLNDQ